jgi:hypothetical protein
MAGPYDQMSTDALIAAASGAPAGAPGGVTSPGVTSPVQRNQNLGRSPMAIRGLAASAGRVASQQESVTQQDAQKYQDLLQSLAGLGDANRLVREDTPTGTGADIMMTAANSGIVRALDPNGIHLGGMTIVPSQDQNWRLGRLAKLQGLTADAAIPGKATDQKANQARDKTFGLDKPPETNQANVEYILHNQVANAVNERIRQHWINRYGSVGATDPSGMTLPTYASMVTLGLPKQGRDFEDASKYSPIVNYKGGKFGLPELGDDLKTIAGYIKTGLPENQAPSRNAVPHPSALRVGDVVEGRPYLGGNPASKGAWGPRR